MNGKRHSQCTKKDHETALNGSVRQERPEETVITSKDGLAVTEYSKGDSNGTVQQAFSRILEFLSNASNETIGACFAGLAAVTYLILGRIGLVLIGILVGVVLRTVWEENGRGAYGVGVDAEAKRREDGLSIVRRVLDLRNIRAADSENSVLFASTSNPSIEELGPQNMPIEVGEAMNHLTDALISDYVRYGSLYLS